MPIQIGGGIEIGSGITVQSPPPSSYQFYGTGANTSFLQMSPGVTIGAGDFTVEFWFDGSDTAQQLGFCGDGSVGALQIYLDNGGNPGDPATGFQVNYNGAGQLSYTSPVSIVSNTWYYFALVRLGGVENIFVNGLPCTPTADTADYSGATTSFGNDYKGSWQGNIFDFRMSNIARYDPNAGSITVPTSPLTSDVNTLVLFDGKFLTGTDASGNQTITQGGSGTPVALSGASPTL